MNHIRLLFCVIALAAGPASVCFAQEQRPSWWNAAWPFRKLIAVPPGGTDGYHLRVFTGNRGAPDGSDLRMAGPDGNLAPLRVVNSSAGAHLIAFEAQPPSHAGGTYALYYGNLKAHAATTVAPRRGLVLRTRPISPDADVSSWTKAEAALGSGPDSGATFHPQVFDATNPFGPAEYYASIYDGFLDCPGSGDYKFATVSDSASFLFVDGELIAEWPGREHNINQGRRGERSGKINLDAGSHEFRYIGFSFGRPSRVVAAWQPPGKPRIEVIPPVVFGKLQDAGVRIGEAVGRSVNSDFVAVPAAYLETGAAQMTGVRFESHSSCRTGSIAATDWDFGDGTQGHGSGIMHAYMLPGTYTVRLNVKSTSGAEDSWTTEVQVLPLWTDADFQAPKKIARFLEVVREYDPSAMPTSHLLALKDFLESQSEATRLFRVNEEIVKRKDGLSPAERTEAIEQMGDYRLLCQGDWRGAEIHYQNALQEADPDSAFVIQAKRAAAAAEWEGDYAGAEAEYQKLLNGSPALTPAQRKRILAGMGNLEQARGAMERARGFYREAEKATEGESAVPTAVADGLFSHNIEVALAARDGVAAKTAMDEWLDRYPTRRMDGGVLVLRLKAHLLRQETSEAARLAEAFLATRSAEEHAPWIAVLAAEAWMAKGRKEEARRHAEAVLEKWPESAATEQARALIERLN